MVKANFGIIRFAEIGLRTRAKRDGCEVGRVGEDAGVSIINSWLLSNKKGITYIVFGILFVVRLISGYVSATNQNNASQSFNIFFITVSLMALTVFVLANKDYLANFNIDRYVVYTFILSGIMLFLSFGLSLTGIIAIACSLTIAKAWFNSKFELNQRRNFSHILLFISIGIIPEVLLKLSFRELYRDYKFLFELSIGTIFVITSITLWNVMVEEMLFRSILWKLLNDWKFSDKKIILIQAFLFWLVHFRFTAFGLPVLVFGVWVGFLTLRSKSLTPAIATHFFHNVTSSLF